MFPSGFIEEIPFQNMHKALVIRSPLARGRIKEIKCPKLPHSCRLITAADIPGKNRLSEFSIPILAGKNLSHKGQPIALLAGPDLSKLEELSLHIELRLEEEDPFFGDDPDTPAVPTDTSVAMSHDNPAKPADTPFPAPPDFIIKREISYRDNDYTSSGNQKIISGTYTTGIQEHWYSEPHGAAAIMSSRAHGSLAVYTATQWPFHVKRSIAGVLGLDSEKVTVYPTLISLHLDGKIWYPSLMACHAALAAWITGKSVILMFSRVEDFLNTPKRNASKIKVSSSLGDDEEILETNVEVKLNLGAEGIFEDEIMDHTCLGSLGFYKRRAFTISGSGIRTNIPPQGPMAGFGLSQGFFAAEMHVSRIADLLGRNPAEWRKNNFLDKNKSLGIGTAVKDPLPMVELIDAAAAMSDYHRKWASYELLRNHGRGQKSTFTEDPLRGIGISVAYQGNGFLNIRENISNCTVEMTLDKDGFLEIKTSLASSGTGYTENWRDMVHEILNVDPGFIRLVNNTIQAPDSGPGTLSRNIGILTRLVELCCQAIRKQRFRDPLPITVKRSAKPNKGQSWADGKIIDNDAFARPGCGAVVVEIEIDPVSLEPMIRGIWLAADGGRILSQRRARHSLHIGIIQALGWTCGEKLYYANGEIPFHLYKGFNLPAPGDIPPIHVDFIRNENSAPKGIGDLPFGCVPSAYVQAVSQAINYPFEKIPLEARDIWNAGIQNNQESS